MEQSKTIATARQHIQKLIDDTELFVNERPFHAFASLAVIIEVLGKCSNPNTDWQYYNVQVKDFDNALTLPSLQKYKSLPFNVRSYLRNGMLHAFFPKNGVTLTNDRNDLPNNIIGCRELYEDIKAAWEEINSGRIQSQKNLDAPLMEYDGPNSAATKNPTQNTVV